MKLAPAYPASETITRKDCLTDYGCGDGITLLDEEHYEGKNDVFDCIIDIG